jgi:hypothetical protein
MPSDKFAVTSLVNSQKSWLKYRDSYCETYSTYHQELNNHANCIVDLNNKRVYNYRTILIRFSQKHLLHFYSFEDLRRFVPVEQF